MKEISFPAEIDRQFQRRQSKYVASIQISPPRLTAARAVARSPRLIESNKASVGDRSDSNCVRVGGRIAAPLVPGRTGGAGSDFGVAATGKFRRPRYRHWWPPRPPRNCANPGVVPAAARHSGTPNPAARIRA